MSSARIDRPINTVRVAPVGACSLFDRTDGVCCAAARQFDLRLGHQCNTLVMGPGGYRFGDYARLGAPLSLLVIIVGVPPILAVWPVG